MGIAVKTLNKYRMKLLSSFWSAFWDTLSKTDRQPRIQTNVSRKIQILTVILGGETLLKISRTFTARRRAKTTAKVIEAKVANISFGKRTISNAPCTMIWANSNMTRTSKRNTSARWTDVSPVSDKAGILLSTERRETT